VSDELPTVSVLTATLNSAAFLEEHLASVDGQSYPNVEHVFVDGGSTDGTVELIRNHAATHNVKWVSEPDSGTSEAVNKAIQMATGDILVMVSSDDLLFPWSVQAGVKYFLAHPEVDIVHGDWMAWDVATGAWHLRLNKPFARGYLGRTQCFAVQATYFRRKVLEELGELDQTYRYANDYDFLLRATSGRITRTVREVLAIYRKWPGALSMLEGATEAVEREVAEIRRRYVNTASPTYGLMRWWDRVYSAAYRRFLLLRMLYGSARFDSKRGFRPGSGPWGGFLTEFEVSPTSSGDLLTMLLPRRRAYAVRIRLRSDSPWRHLPWMNAPETS